MFDSEIYMLAFLYYIICPLILTLYFTFMAQIIVFHHFK